MIYLKGDKTMIYEDSRQIKEFINPLHQRLWRKDIDIFPLVRTTAWIKNESLLKSCHDLYHYIVDAKDDILENSQEYGIRSDGLGYCAEKAYFHRFILEKFLDIAVTIEKGYMLIKADDYSSMLKSFKKKMSKDIIFTKEFTFDHLLNTLARRGMITQCIESEIIIKNDRYPEMFLSANLLHQADIKYYNRTKRTPQFFSLLDFREIYEDKRKWDVEDIISGWYDDQKEYVYRFIEYVSQKVKLSKSCKIWYYRTAEFKYKKRMLFIIRWGKSYAFDIGIPFPDPMSHEYYCFENEINKLSNSDEIKDFCIKNLRTCNFCGPNCMRRNAYKKEWLFFGRSLGKLVKSCEQNIIVEEFNETNYNYFKALIDVYIKCLEKA